MSGRFQLLFSAATMLQRMRLGPSDNERADLNYEAARAAAPEFIDC
jgi:hypothetical protein